MVELERGSLELRKKGLVKEMSEREEVYALSEMFQTVWDN